MRSSSEAGNGVPRLHKMGNLVEMGLDTVHLHGRGDSGNCRQVELSKRPRFEQYFFLLFIFVHKSTNKIVDILVLKQVSVLR